MPPSAPTPTPPPRSPTELPHDGGRLQRVEIAAILGFWTLFAALTTANRLLDPYVPAGPTGELGETAFWFFRGYLWAAVTVLVFWAVGRLQSEGAGWGAHLVRLLALGVAAVLLMDLLRDVVWVKVLRFEQGPGPARPEPSLLARLLNPWIVNELLTYAGVVAAAFAREYFVRYRLRREEAVRLQAHAAQLQAQLADARLEALRMQINPHFLFNTLHAVSALVERDPRGVRRMIARLSELLRQTIEGPGTPEVPLEEELSFLRRYLEIMQVRFQGRLEVETRVDAELMDAMVPTLILQPLVENAVKHGVSQSTGEGRIELHARREGDRLVLGVRDHGPGPQPGDAPAQGAGVGLRNVRARLEQLYGGEQALELRPAEGGGSVAEIRLPYHTRSDLRASGLSDLPVGSSHGG